MSLNKAGLTAGSLVEAVSSVYFHQSHLGDLVDVQELGKPDAEHVCGQPDGTSALLINLAEPGPTSTAAYEPHWIVEDPDLGLPSITVPWQAACPALAPSTSHTSAGADPPPYLKDCRTTPEHRVGLIHQPAEDRHREQKRFAFT